MEVQSTFERYEKKFLLTQVQYERILPLLKKEMAEDCYGSYTVCNIYFDTDFYDLIRASLDKPNYKEKFRLRSYGVPGGGGLVFAEIKKKYDGIVYKRRVGASPAQIQAFLKEGERLSENLQIQREIQWFLGFYRPKPKVFIGYDRIALAGKEDKGIRITFDFRIRWRMDRLTLQSGDEGEPVLNGDEIVMEVKTPGAIPLWLADALNKYEIYPLGFSKFGVCYQRHIAASLFQGGYKIC